VIGFGHNQNLASEKYSISYWYALYNTDQRISNKMCWQIANSIVKVKPHARRSRLSSSKSQNRFNNHKTKQQFSISLLY